MFSLRETVVLVPPQLAKAQESIFVREKRQGSESLGVRNTSLQFGRRTKTLGLNEPPCEG